MSDRPPLKPPPGPPRPNPSVAADPFWGPVEAWPRFFRWLHDRQQRRQDGPREGSGTGPEAGEHTL